MAIIITEMVTEACVGSNEQLPQSLKDACEVLKLHLICRFIHTAPFIHPNKLSIRKPDNEYTYQPDPTSQTTPTRIKKKDHFRGEGSNVKSQSSPFIYITSHTYTRTCTRTCRITRAFQHGLKVRLSPSKWKCETHCK